MGADTNPFSPVLPSPSCLPPSACRALHVHLPWEWVKNPPNCRMLLKSNLAFVGLCLQSAAKALAVWRTGE